MYTCIYILIFTRHVYNLTCIQDNIYPKNIHCYIIWVLNSYFPPNLTDMCLARARVQINLCPSDWWCIDICWYLDLGPSHRKYKCTLSHVNMSALLLKLQTEREKREALEHEVDIIKRRLEERSVVQSAADYKQTLFSEMLHVQLYLRTGTEATHRQYSEGCLLPHAPSFPCNSHRHPSCVIAELQPSRRSGNSLRPPRALPCFSRPLNVKRCLPEAPASNDVYRIPNASSSVDHVPKSTRLSRGEPGRFWHVIHA